MIGKRGIRRTSMRVRLAVAAAVLVGGGAAGVAVAVSHSSSSATAVSAGYYMPVGRSMTYTSAMSEAMNSWSKSPSESLALISHMKPVVNYWTQSWHHATIFIQRGTVIATAKNEIVVKSKDGVVEVWHLNGGTKTLNVGGSSTGTSAMTGGTLSMPSWWRMNTKVKGIAKGDVVFVFGERENHTLKAQLVLFAAPTTTTVTPTATPTTAMPTATATATPTATTTPTAVVPAATTPAATTPAVTPTVTSSNQFSGKNS